MKIKYLIFPMLLGSLMFLGACATGEADLEDPANAPVDGETDVIEESDEAEVEGEAAE